MTTIHKDDEWIYEALARQLESETGLKVASMGIKMGHILGERFEDFDFLVKRYQVVLQRVEFELETDDD